MGEKNEYRAEGKDYRPSFDGAAASFERRHCLDVSDAEKCHRIDVAEEIVCW